MVEFESFIQYENQRNEYLTNGEKLLAEGKYRKASEMFWGAATQTIKAVAILYDMRLSSHGQINKFLERIANDTKDQELLILYDTMQRFHRNFYDEQLDLKGVQDRIEPFKTFLKKLEIIAQKRYKELGKEYSSRFENLES